MFLTNILLGFDRYFYFPHIYLGLQFALERNLLMVERWCPELICSSVFLAQYPVRLTKREK